jgi:hypothetical protein
MSTEDQSKANAAARRQNAEVTRTEAVGRTALTERGYTGGGFAVAKTMAEEDLEICVSAKRTRIMKARFWM